MGLCLYILAEYCCWFHFFRPSGEKVESVQTKSVSLKMLLSNVQNVSLSLQFCRSGDLHGSQ